MRSSSMPMASPSGAQVRTCEPAHPTLDLAWVAREMDGVSLGWGMALEDALRSGDAQLLAGALANLSAVTLHHIRRRADALDRRLGLSRPAG